MVYVPGEGYVVCKVQKTASGGRMELRQPSRHPAVSANRFNGGECDAGGFRIRGYNLQEALYKVREDESAFKRRKLSYSIDNAFIVFAAWPLKSITSRSCV